MAAAPAAPVPQDILVPESPSDSVSSLHFAPQFEGQQTNADLLCSSSWDSSVCVWEVRESGECIPRAKNQQSQPVLCTSWSPDRTRIAFGGCEAIVKVWDVQSNQTMNVGQHGKPVKQLIDLTARAAQLSQIAPNLPSLVSAGWDATVKYWDLKSSNGTPALEVKLADKAYCMDQQELKLAVATAERHIHIFDLRKLDTPLKSIPSPLKFQSRCIALFPNAEGFALGSIEGRVAIHHLVTPAPAQDFAFKCHRQGDTVFAVNQIVFHPKHGTFATTGGDGVYTFWDKDSKQRLKVFPPQKNAILAGDFNPAGTLFAYAVGYDWSQGLEGYEAKKLPNHIALHKVPEGEAARKPIPR